MTITDLTPIEILASDFAVPCDGPDVLVDTHTCLGENPAVWVLFMAACCPKTPRQILLCEPCKGYLLSWDFCTCEFCDHRFDPPSKAILRIEPIGGAR